MQNLKEFREAGAKRYQKKEIAAALGITEPTLTAIEDAQADKLTATMADKLGKHFGIDGNIFLGILKFASNETERTMNENYIDIELGGWNVPEAITVEAEPVEARDFSDFEL